MTLIAAAPRRRSGGRWPARASASRPATASTSAALCRRGARQGRRRGPARLRPRRRRPRARRSRRPARCRCRPTSPPAAPPDAADRDDYQTVFAARPGAVAAPDRLAPLRRSRSSPPSPPAASARPALTLHVGAGTFLPVKVEDIAAHRMHAEWGEIGPAAVEAVARDPRRRRPGDPGRHHRAPPARDRGDRTRRHRALVAARPTSSSAPATTSASPTG